VQKGEVKKERQRESNKKKLLGKTVTWWARLVFGREK